MNVLELEAVGKRYGDGLRGRLVLREASLQLQSGELAVVWGLRRSGRSTLLRIAAGIEAPDTGVVRFEGRDLTEHAESVLGDGIGYCQKTFRSAEGRTALEEVAIGLLARGVPGPSARVRAREALERTGAERLAACAPHELDGGEIVRVALARALALKPRLLIVDEPVKGVDLLERDAILALLRSLPGPELTVLASTGEATGLSAADRTFSLGDGELRSGPAPALAPVLELLPSAQRRASG
jgi:energy-coupling factor transporter ATP-binding protein EcfA2